MYFLSVTVNPVVLCGLDTGNYKASPMGSFCTDIRRGRHEGVGAMVGANILMYTLYALYLTELISNLSNIELHIILIHHWNWLNYTYYYIIIWMVGNLGKSLS